MAGRIDRSESVAATGYAYGDSEVAARRLALVDQVFAGATESFLRVLADARPDVGVVLDLGCGPGCSTKRLHRALGATTTVGIDTSEPFLELARSNTVDNGRSIRFEQHDASHVPFPVDHPDIVYCRLLLAHMPDPELLLSMWSEEVAPGGLVAADEVEAIEPAHPLLARYEEMTLAVVEARGAHMYAGPLIASATERDRRLRPVVDRVVTLDVATGEAARMFSLNLETWRGSPAVTERWSAAEVDEVAHGLVALSTSTATGDIAWRLRQSAFERT